MRTAVRVLAYLFASSYLLMLLYVALDTQQLYQGQHHLQFALASLGLAWLVKFVQSGSVQAVLLATILVPMVKVVLSPSAEVFTTTAVGIFNLLFLFSYVLVIWQLAKLRRQQKFPS